MKKAWPKQMPKVEIRKKQITVGKEKIPLLSGEVHYWRLNPFYWKQVLHKVREMGLRVVSTYVPWQFHEYQRGHFDFTGKTDPARNLKAFLELTKKEGFWVIIRPGPYIYSEWPNDGVPNYAHRYHRLHPQFLKYAQTYLKRVTRVIAPYLATRRGGHIVLLQADNEIDPWPDLFGHQYGLGDKPGLFQEFLRDQYQGDIQELNEVWGTQYRHFREAGPFIATMLKEEQGLCLKGDKELRRNLDYFRFKYEYARRCAEWNVQAYRTLGIDIPIYLNVYPFFYAHDWQLLQKEADFIGLDIYPSSEFAEDAFELRKFMDKIRYLQTVSKVPFIAEFASGVWHARHYETGILTPNHYRLTALSAILAGAAGWNWYMLVNRDNWYMSPINEWGAGRPELFDVFKQTVKMFRQMAPAQATKLTDVGVTFNTLQYAAKTVTHNSPILGALYEGDIDYEIFDVRAGKYPKKCLFYSGNQWLARESQKKLRAYVEEGGTLVAFRNYPRKDERFQPCSMVGFEEPKSLLFEFKQALELQFSPRGENVSLHSSVFSFEVRGVQSIKASFEGYGKQTIGYVKKVGKGRLVHLGVEPTGELLQALLNHLGIAMPSYSATAEVKTGLLKRGERTFLVAVNNGSEDKSVRVHLPYWAGRRVKLSVRNLMEGTQSAFSPQRRLPFTFEIPRKDGRVFEFRHQ